MTRKSKREIERALEELTADVAAKEGVVDEIELSDADEHDARALLRYRQKVAAETGVHIDDHDTLVSLLKTARGNVGAGDVTVDALTASAEAIGFTASENADTSEKFGVNGKC